MKNLKIFLLLLLASGWVSVKPAIAQYYGNDGVKPIIVVDKKIKLPTTDKFVDNIDKGTYIFTEGTQIEFLISVENRSTVVIKDVKLVDVLPKYLKLQYIFGSDNKNGKLETNIDQLNPGEVKEYKIIALLKDLPNTDQIMNLKQINRACASNSVVSDCDNTVYYIGTKSLPVTGNSLVNLIFESIFLTGLVIGGFALRKIVRG